MATVREAMEVAARQCSVTVPSDWITTTDITILELKDFLVETVDELLDRIDWPSPLGADTTITGTGASSYSLPSAFKRLTRDSWAVYETTTTRRRCVPIVTNGEWTHLNELGSAGAFRYYRVLGDEESGYTIEFYQTLDTGQEAICSYVGKNWLKTGGTAAATWTLAADTLMLPRRLIELGVIWRFRRRKGLVFTDIYNDYEIKLMRLSNDARGSRTLNFGGHSDNIHPMRVPVPDEIPTA